MEILRNNVKSLRTSVSEVIERSSLELGESYNPSVEKAVDNFTEAFMMLGKILSYTGDPDPYINNEVTQIPDWTKEKFAVGDNAINDVKKLREDTQKMISHNVFNHLLDVSTDAGQSFVKFNDRQWFYTMAALTDLVKGKHWLGMYLNQLYLDESPEDKKKRLAEDQAKIDAEKKALYLAEHPIVKDKKVEKVKKENFSGSVTLGTVTPSSKLNVVTEKIKAPSLIEKVKKMDAWKAELDKAGIKYHPSLGYNKLKVLYDENFSQVDNSVKAGNGEHK